MNCLKWVHHFWSLQPLFRVNFFWWYLHFFHSFFCLGTKFFRNYFFRHCLYPTYLLPRKEYKKNFSFMILLPFSLLISSSCNLVQNIFKIIINSTFNNMGADWYSGYCLWQLIKMAVLRSWDRFQGHMTIQYPWVVLSICWSDNFFNLQKDAVSTWHSSRPIWC